MASAALLLALWAQPALAARAPAAQGELVITEFMAQPADIPPYYGEWFEVRNTTSEELDLDNLLVRGEEGEEGFQITGETLIGPGDYLVLGVSADTALNGGVTVDYVYDHGDSGMELVHTGDEIRLMVGTTVIDRLVWTSADGWAVTESTSSYQLGPYAENSEWANDLAHNWCNSQQFAGSIYATPGAENDYCGEPSDDVDGDGYTLAEGDCDDEDPDVHPDLIDGAAAPYGVSGDDRNCDGRRDDGEIDDDDDGFTETEGDCDDGDADLNPGVLEADDGIDNDCNGCIDDFDGDGDGWTLCWTGGVEDCNPDDEVDCSVFATTGTVGDSADPPRFVLDATTHDLFAEGACALSYDHDDDEPAGEDPSRYPCAEEIAYDGIDQSGDGYDACDVDGDGFPGGDCAGAPAPGFTQTDDNGDPVEEDCDDRNAQVFPGGDEGDPREGGIPDNEDNDCDGVVDGPYLDLDGDGVTVLEGDCRDALPEDDALAVEVFPGATEVCGDGIDNDCNGLADDGCTMSAALGSLGGGGICGVAATSGSAGLAWLAALGVLLARRREERN